MNNRNNRPQGKGTSSRQHLLDRYKQHLQSADLKMSAGDRVGAENDFQHADHFFRAAAEQKDSLQQ